MAYSAKKIANYFIDRALTEEVLVDQLKVQKLVYFANGWYLALEDEPLIIESVEAWKHGPVIPSLYRNLREYGHDPVVRMITDYSDGRPLVPEIDASHTRTLNILNRVWEVYGGLTSIQITNMTHKEGSPWNVTYKEMARRGMRNSIIDSNLIRDYFKSLPFTKKRRQRSGDKD